MKDALIIEGMEKYLLTKLLGAVGNGLSDEEIAYLAKKLYAWAYDVPLANVLDK